MGKVWTPKDIFLSRSWCFLTCWVYLQLYVRHFFFIMYNECFFAGLLAQKFKNYCIISISFFTDYLQKFRLLFSYWKHSTFLDLWEKSWKWQSTELLHLSIYILWGPTIHLHNRKWYSGCQNMEICYTKVHWRAVYDRTEFTEYRSFCSVLFGSVWYFWEIPNRTFLTKLEQIWAHFLLKNF